MVIKIIAPDDATYLGNTNPHYIAGLSNNYFHYKGFDLNIFFQGAFDYYLYNMNRLVLESTRDSCFTTGGLPNTHENTSVPGKDIS